MMLKRGVIGIIFLLLAVNLVSAHYLYYDYHNHYTTKSLDRYFYDYDNFYKYRDIYYSYYDNNYYRPAYEHYRYYDEYYRRPIIYTYPQERVYNKDVQLVSFRLNPYKSDKTYFRSYYDYPYYEKTIDNGMPKYILKCIDNYCDDYIYY